MICKCKVPGCKVGKQRAAEKERLQALIENNYKLQCTLVEVSRKVQLALKTTAWEDHLEELLAYISEQLLS